MADKLFGPMAISASGMSAQRKRMEAIAQNIANAETTRTEDGGVYRRKKVVFETKEVTATASIPSPSLLVNLSQTEAEHLGLTETTQTEHTIQMVEATEIEDPDASFDLVHDPHHPDADEDGYVRVPDINTVTEMVDMIAATRAYEANLSAMKAYQSIVEKSLEI